MSQSERYGSAIGSLLAVPVLSSYHIERGTFMVGMDFGVGGPGRCIFEGLGLLRGVAYTAPDVQRGYLVSQHGPTCHFLDAATGKIVEARSDEAVEVEERYRSGRLSDLIPAAHSGDGES